MWVKHLAACLLFCFIVVYYFLLLQLRECLDSEVYELFHKKLTEQALIKDPKFLWCCHVSSGAFIFYECDNSGCFSQSVIFLFYIHILDSCLKTESSVNV